MLATCVAGTPVVAWAAITAARSHPTPRSLFGVALFFGFTAFAEWRPVPIDAAGKQLVSLAFVFIIATQLLFGWEWSVLIGAAAIGIAMASTRVQPVKVAFNSAAYALAAGTAALPTIDFGQVSGARYGRLAAMVTLDGSVFVVANVLLVCIAIGLATESSPMAAFRDHLRFSGPIFAIMIPVAMQAVIFWRLSAPLVILLSAPLFALTLYQRSSVRHRVAEEEAATDSLTSLQNRREFDRRSEEALETAMRSRASFALCLIDIDYFKQVNDRNGHLVGDAIITALAAAIEKVAPGHGFRLGGDEFALILEHDAAKAEALMAELEQAFTAGQGDLVPELVTISSGIATFPEHADDLHSLKKRADMALYQSKFNGRARATVYSDAARGAATREAPFELPLIDIRLVTAQRLASLVDAISEAGAEAEGSLPPGHYTDVLDRWRSFDGNHSRSVADLTIALARRLGIARDELDQIELAALLHDVGKIAMPEAVLSKPGPLNENERDLVERHPLIGFELLRGMGLSPVDTYVLHHHERWDGSGYPHGLAGSEIPLGSRLILVADAFDALTSNRSYRRAISAGAALDEIEGGSGRQFDPLVVAALREHLAHSEGAETEAGAVGQEVAWSS